MGGSSRTALLWGSLGVGSYVVGGAVLLVAVSGSWTPDGFEPGALTSLHALAIGVSIALFAAGGYCTSRVRATVGPPESDLPDRFRRGPRSSDERPERRRGDRSARGGADRRDAGTEPVRDPEREDHPAPSAPDDGENAPTVRCPHCGAENDSGFTFCANCSGRLDD